MKEKDVFESQISVEFDVLILFIFIENLLKKNRIYLTKMSNFNMKKCSKSKIFDQDDLKNDENFNKDEPDVKSEVVTDSDESLSIKKSKRKKSKIKKVKKVSSKENKNFEKQFLLDNSTVKLENESEGHF